MEIKGLAYIDMSDDTLQQQIQKLHAHIAGTNYSSFWGELRNLHDTDIHEDKYLRLHVLIYDDTPNIKSHELVFVPLAWVQDKVNGDIINVPWVINFIGEIELCLTLDQTVYPEYNDSGYKTFEAALNQLINPQLEVIEMKAQIKLLPGLVGTEDFLTKENVLYQADLYWWTEDYINVTTNMNGSDVNLIEENLDTELFIRVRVVPENTDRDWQYAFNTASEWERDFPTHIPLLLLDGKNYGDNITLDYYWDPPADYECPGKIYRLILEIIPNPIYRPHLRLQQTLDILKSGNYEFDLIEK